MNLQIDLNINLDECGKVIDGNVVNENTVDDKDDKNLEPYTRLEFDAQDDAYFFYLKYAKYLGFSISKKFNGRSKLSGEFIDAKFTCTRYGLRHGHRSKYGRALQANEASVYSNHVNGEYTNCVRDELGQKNAILNCGQPRLQYSRFATAAAEAYNIEPSTDGDSHVSEEYANVNWDGLGFGLTPTDYMYIMNCSKGQKFSQGTLTRFGKTEMNPSSGILNYGQVPPPGKGTMYIRPLLMGNGPDLGVAPASEYTFVTYASPVGNYHKGALNLVVEEKFRRATPGGTGGVKAITNYAIIYKPISEAKAKGFTDVLFLDAVTGKYVEEASTSNIFVVKENVISTPPTNGTILPGITRKSIIEIARVLGYQVEERAILVEELFDAEEVFCTGTAVVVNPVNSITYQDKRTEYKRGVGTVGQKLYEILTGIQSGCIEDEMGWTVELD
ncbi:Branched-chain-amino-acid aminotransferase 6 [Citrus sinensis]|uniref:Branched-chain-amino-acid aminotransferase 6 n=1 Tax=Citrus sinensis TaxID=2711 RepID=A0ACB8IEV6_CITSI|nr:Branched-chain-amino-acid aminotransferase 6 [Citrus sinensis]